MFTISMKKNLETEILYRPTKKQKKKTKNNDNEKHLKKDKRKVTI